MEGLRVGIKFCGGCNPRYDRPALVSRLAGRFPRVCFLPVAEGERYDAVAVVCGCLAACARPPEGEWPIFWITGDTAVLEAWLSKQANAD